LAALSRLIQTAKDRNLELAEAAKNSLLHFTKYTYPQYIAEPAHRLIAAKLDQVVDGEIDRLMIFAPPQHGKSELASVRLPAYWLAKRPDQPVIISSYAATLAYSKSGQARDCVGDQRYRWLFPEIRLSAKSQAVDEWHLAGKRGYLKAAGVGGPVTGHGALLGVIDDPFENWEQAQSETYRRKVYEWWQGTFRTRIWEGGRVVLILTRWHEDDLAGRLLKAQPGRWQVLRLPAIAETQDVRDYANQRMGLPEGEPDPLGREPGEALCPDRFSRETLDGIREDVGSMVWGAEYQGAPTLPEGNRFKRHWFDQVIDAVPTPATRIRYWDNAATEEGGAYTAGVLLGIRSGHWFIEDTVRGQWSTGQRRAVMRQTAELDRQRHGGRIRQIIFEQEPGSAGVDSARDTIRYMAGFPIKADKVTGSKDVRLEPFAAQAEAHNVILKRGIWNGPWLDEICAIPNGRYRDQADATAGAFNALAKLRHSIRSGTY